MKDSTKQKSCSSRSKCRERTSQGDGLVVEPCPRKSEHEVVPWTKALWQSYAQDCPAQTLEGRQDPEGSHWGCSQGTFRCQSDQHLRREQLQEAEFEVRSGVKHVAKDFFGYRFPVK